MESRNVHAPVHGSHWLSSTNLFVDAFSDSPAAFPSCWRYTTTAAGPACLVYLPINGFASGDHKSHKELLTKVAERGVVVVALDVGKGAEAPHPSSSRDAAAEKGGPSAVVGGRVEILSEQMIWEGF